MNKKTKVSTIVFSRWRGSPNFGKYDGRPQQLNNLVSAYFDLAELNAIEEREMHMADYVCELDTILSSRVIKGVKSLLDSFNPFL